MTPDSVRTEDYQPRPESLPPGPDPVPTRIGRFVVTGVLGSGAFGRVYRATDPRLGRDVAIKVPLASAVETGPDRERFLREARAAAGLHHPNICPVHEVGEENGHPYIVMGFVPGQSLAGVLKARREPLAPKQAALIARKLALALDAAHKKGVVHRDLKPANVMFDRERRDVVVTDFGLARAPRPGDAEATRSGVLMGTPAYMSPEQARGDTKTVGPASDQFALGVMLYEMLVGRRPFTGTVAEVLGKILHVDPEPPTKLRPDLDPGLAAVCLKALARDPAGRYLSMKQFAEALAPYASDGPAAKAAAPAAAAETVKAATDTQRLADVFAFTEEAVEKAIRKHQTPTWAKVGLALLVVLGLVAVGSVVFFTRSDKVKVTIELTDVDLADKSLSFFLDDESISAEALAKPVELKPGDHVLTVKRGKEIVKRVLLSVTGGRNPGVTGKDITPPPAQGAPPPKNDADGWTPLFNGKDLTGWTAHPDAKARWRVEGGYLTASGPVGHLFTERNDYENFVFRVEARINDGGNSGQYFRTAFGPGFPRGYEAQINATQRDPIKTGSLYPTFDPALTPAQKDRLTIKAATHRPGEWFTQELTAVGNRITIKVNGQTTVDFVDEKNTFRKGHLALQHHDPATRVEFRKVEVKELPR